jgi:WD40 repeat protein
VARLGTTRLGHAGVIQAIAYSPDGKTLVTASGSIRIWDAANGRLVREMAKNPDWPIRSLAVAPDGRFLVTLGKHVAAPDGKSEGRLPAPPQLWDLAKEMPRPTQLYPKPAGVAAFSPDGSRVAVSDGAEIVLLERASGRALCRLKGHQDHILDLAFAPDGRLLVSASYDLTALVWNVR